MKLLLSGSHGLIGSALSAELTSDGHEVIPLGRDFSVPIDFSGVHAVIHLAGESIADGRWNASKKKRIEESRVAGTTHLSEQIQNSPNKPDIFISSSAIGYYGDRGTETIDECCSAGSGFLSNVCVKWEASTKAAEISGVRTIKLRTGIVLSTEGGALQKMLPPFKLGGGGILGSGGQFMSWISIEDVVGIIRFLIKSEAISGPVNLVSPNPVTNREFTKTLGCVLRRPTFMPLPAFAAKMMFGEMAEALLLSSTRVIPGKLVDAGYRFKHADLRIALEDILR